MISPAPPVRRPNPVPDPARRAVLSWLAELTTTGSAITGNRWQRDAVHAEIHPAKRAAR